MDLALGVQLTELCAPGCAICAAGRSRSGAGEARSLSPDAFERALIEARAVGIERVILGGGEPLVHEDLNAIVDLVLKVGVHVEVLLTGYRLEQREPALKRLAAAKRLACAWAEFYGGTAALHERTTGRPGSFQEARGALECAEELGVPRGARLIPTAPALREVDAWKAAVGRFSPRFVIDRSTSHLPRAAWELRERAERCGDEESRIVAAIAADGRIHPCFASIGAGALESSSLPLVDEVRLRDALAIVAQLPAGNRCGACPASFDATRKKLGESRGS